MSLKSKIDLDAIDRAHRALDALPQRQPDQLTKRQAVQSLLGPIRASRAKGYSLAAISKLFSECGISITTGALRAYVSDAGEAGGKKRRRPVKRGADAGKRAESARSEGNANTATARAPAAPEQRVGTGREQHVDLDWEPVAQSGNGPAGAGSPGVRQDLEGV
jgi:hypothetical protein